MSKRLSVEKSWDGQWRLKYANGKKRIQIFKGLGNMGAKYE